MAAAVVDPLSHPASDARDCQEDEMPARKTKGKGAADARPPVRAEELAAAESAAAVSLDEAIVGAAEVTRGEDEEAEATTLSALSEAAAQRGAHDAAEGEATLSLAEEVAAGGALAAALGTDEFQRGMELAGIAGQLQVVAELLHGVGQPTLAAFLGRTSHQLRSAVRGHAAAGHRGRRRGPWGGARGRRARGPGSERGRCRPRRIRGL